MPLTEDDIRPMRRRAFRGDFKRNVGVMDSTQYMAAFQSVQDWYDVLPAPQQTSLRRVVRELAPSVERAERSSLREALERLGNDDEAVLAQFTTDPRAALRVEVKARIAVLTPIIQAEPARKTRAQVWATHKPALQPLLETALGRPIPDGAVARVFLVAWLEVTHG